MLLIDLGVAYAPIADRIVVAPTPDLGEPMPAQDAFVEALRGPWRCDDADWVEHNADYLLGVSRYKTVAAFEIECVHREGDTVTFDLSPAPEATALIATMMPGCSLWRGKRGAHCSKVHGASGGHSIFVSETPREWREPYTPTTCTSVTPHTHTGTRVEVTVEVDAGAFTNRRSDEEGVPPLRIATTLPDRVTTVEEHPVAPGTGTHTFTVLTAPAPTPGVCTVEVTAPVDAVQHVKVTGVEADGSRHPLHHYPPTTGLVPGPGARYAQRVWQAARADWEPAGPEALRRLSVWVRPDGTIMVRPKSAGDRVRVCA